MAESPHRYVRGATERFYEWLHEDNRKTVPAGPRIWICGDCHIGNLGPLQSPSGKIDIQIRDLDQTTIGNPAYDIVRLALSLSSDARGSSLSGSMTARILETVVDAYTLAFSRARAKRDAKDDEPPKAVVHALRASRTRGWKALANESIDGPSPQIPLGARFWPLRDRERSAVEDFIHSPESRKLVTVLSHRPDDAKVHFVDAAYWVKGCSSLGLSRYAALACVEAKRYDREYCLIDLKEARESIAPRSPGATTPEDNALRVVAGAAQLAPNLGERMTTVNMLGKAFFARELMPADLKLEVERLSEDEALLSARYLARVVGVAHRQQLNPDERAAWKRELDGKRSKSLDAPSWLWRSVVDLLARHERAYLEHCRRVIASA